MDLENVVRIGVLLDIYGELLPDRTRICMERYYNEDWSLAEISGDLAISRQAVHDHLQRAVEQLERYESVLRLAAGKSYRRERVMNVLAQMSPAERIRYAAQLETLIE